MLIADDLDKLLAVLPDNIRKPLETHPDKTKLIEIVLDLGRKPEARFPGKHIYLSTDILVWQDLDYITNNIGNFSDDNRAGIEQTLHRISCIRNRDNIIIGLTCRVGRAIFGTISIIRDILEHQKSILLLGKPGVGKTTTIREIARVFSDEMKKRVVIIDTSNEIAGDGDIPHPAIGKARRMQVTQPELQHQVMVEAVENHMPEVIIIDEIGTELEALAARTIAERGVLLIGTAHGNSLENLIKNPVLSDLIGGIQYVTLGDEEAKRRGTQKSILERKAPPAFDIAVEVHENNKWVVHQNVEQSVDQILQGYEPIVEKRQTFSKNRKSIFCSLSFNNSNAQYNEIVKLNVEEQLQFVDQKKNQKMAFTGSTLKKESTLISLYVPEINSQYIEPLIKELSLPINLTDTVNEADAFLVLRDNIRNNQVLKRRAQLKSIPIYSLEKPTIPQITRALRKISTLNFNK